MELGAAITVILASQYGLPVSTTMCITGATMGVALCNGDVSLSSLFFLVTRSILAIRNFVLISFSIVTVPRYQLASTGNDLPRMGSHRSGRRNAVRMRDGHHPLRAERSSSNRCIILNHTLVSLFSMSCGSSRIVLVKSDGSEDFFFVLGNCNTLFFYL